jgi:transposase
MRNSENVKKLKNHLKKLKKQKLNPSMVRTIIRIKALIAYYKGAKLDVVARCYDITEKSLKEWIKRFEKSGLEDLNDEDRSGRPTKLPKECRLAD